MRTHQNRNVERPCLTFCRLDVSAPAAVAEFIRWLCDATPDEEPRSQLTQEELLETLWGWDAPRQRMAQLLWQLLQGSDDPEHFRRKFVITDRLAQQVANCRVVLGPIQEQLLWVLEGLMARQKQDTVLGQGDWGEEWWLPAKQTAYVRKQLQRAHADLLEQTSNYEDALQRVIPGYHELASEDPKRIYVGTYENAQNRVYVEDSGGERFPLSQARLPFRQTPGTGFAWGYGGYGPGKLAMSVLADATGGDLEIADRLDDAFVETVVAELPLDGDFRLPRQEVLAWLDSHGVGAAELDDAAGRVAQIKKRFGPAVSEHKERLAEVGRLGGLVAQRFDLVPPDFECALYVDLMHLLEQSGWVLRCSRCRLPIPCDRSPRSNRQRARWKGGRPVYHQECFAERARERKRAYWSKRTKSAAFRVAERGRARLKRKIDKVNQR